MQRLIDASLLKGKARRVQIYDGVQNYNAYVVLVSDIDSASTIDASPKWIPVSKPPQEYRDKYGNLIPFLVCMDYADYPFRAVYDGENWSDGICAIPVTWWMPLPELPRG